MAYDYRIASRERITMDGQPNYWTSWALYAFTNVAVPVIVLVGLFLGAMRFSKPVKWQKEFYDQLLKNGHKMIELQEETNELLRKLIADNK
jgi:hypothetical protein